jgi:hypothetical protein
VPVEDIKAHILARKSGAGGSQVEKTGPVPGYSGRGRTPLQAPGTEGLWSLWSGVWWPQTQTLVIRTLRGERIVRSATTPEGESP